MNKASYIEKIAQDNRHRQLPKQAIKEIVDDTFQFILRSLKQNGKFMYAGLGTFRVKQRKGKFGTNPNTGEKISIAPRRAVSFTASEKLKKRCNKK